MTQYSVTGMSCAACSTRVEKAVSAVPGVTSCAVSLLTNSMGVDGTAAPADIVRAVENAGYGASLKGAKRAAPAAAADELADHETPKLKKRLMSSVAVLLVLMYFSMGHMWGAPMPRWLHHNSVGMGLIQLLLAGIVLVINQNFFISGFRSAVKGAPNMDTLVAMGSAAAYLWSVYELFTLTIDPMAEADLYFESAAMILTLITVGKTLEAHSKGKTTDALRSLMQLSPKTARLERNGEEVVVPAEDVVLGDTFLVRPGDSIPVDGVVLSGASAVNESALTGESLPVDKAENDKVSAGTINQSGFLRCRATGVGEDTALSQIIRMVSDAAATKAPIAKTADKVAGVFVPTVIGIAAVTIIVWLLVGQTFGYALARGISVLVISCPCALVISVPLSFFGGIGGASKLGVLIKGSNYLETLADVDTVVFDKTGPLTNGTFSVVAVHPEAGYTEQSLLEVAALAESFSDHPIAQSVSTAYQGEVDPKRVSDSANDTGHGVTATIDGKHVVVGNAKMLAAAGVEAPDCEVVGTILHVLVDGVYAGHIVIADTVKADAEQTIRDLHAAGVKRTVMLTGDREEVAAAVAKQLGLDEFHAQLLPGDKVERVEALLAAESGKGKLAFVGDGINDAPVLTRADVGIAMGAMGSDAAIEAADVVLMDDKPSNISRAIRVARKTMSIVWQNIIFALGIKLLILVLAALGIANMWLAVFGDVGVAIIAILNAMRAMGVKNL